LSPLAWLMALAVLATASLFILNRVAPRQTGRRIEAHCVIGLASVVLAAAYYVADLSGYASLSSGVFIGLLLLTAGSGMLLRFVPNAGELRYHAASFHPPIVVALLLALLALLMGGAGA
jgi:predicted membrane channel-forming protein YqfA (hemolysin III family)